MSQPEPASRCAIPAPIPTVRPTPVIRARGRAAESDPVVTGRDRPRAAPGAASAFPDRRRVTAPTEDLTFAQLRHRGNPPEGAWLKPASFLLKFNRAIREFSPYHR